MMLDAWNFVLSVLWSTIGNPQFAMFCIVLLWILFVNKEEKMRIYPVYSIFFFLIYFFPPAAYVIITYALGTQVFWRMFWLLPLGLVLSYSITYWESEVKGACKKGLYVMLTVAIFWMSVGGNTPFSVVEGTENPLKIPNGVIEVIEVILEDADENGIEIIQGTFPGLMYPFVPQYTGRIRTSLNGYHFLVPQEWHFDERSERVIFELMSLSYFDIVYKRPMDWHKLGRELNVEGSNYLVVWNYLPGLEYFNSGFNKIAVVNEYAIFRRDKFVSFVTEYRPSQIFFEQEVDKFGRLDFAPVFDFMFFINRYEHVKEKYEGNPRGALSYFVNYGMSEGLQASFNFNVFYYKNNNPDLEKVFGDDLEMYYFHFLAYGISESRVTFRCVEETTYQERDFFFVYDFEFFINHNRQILYDEGIDLSDREDVFEFFVHQGMERGLQGSRFFDVDFYKRNNPDLSNIFGYNLMEYYIHFMEYGQRERRFGFQAPPF